MTTTLRDRIAREIEDECFDTITTTPGPAARMAADRILALMPAPIRVTCCRNCLADCSEDGRCDLAKPRQVTPHQGPPPDWCPIHAAGGRIWIEVGDG